MSTQLSLFEIPDKEKCVYLKHPLPNQYGYHPLYPDWCTCIYQRCIYPDCVVKANDWLRIFGSCATFKE